MGQGTRHAGHEGQGTHGRGQGAGCRHGADRDYSHAIQTGVVR